MPDQEEVEKLLADFRSLRDERLDLLPDRNSLKEIIADAMNALEIAYVSIHLMTETNKQSPQAATFVPVSNPKDAKPL